MNPGHKSPSSNESTVPDTAPTANRIAVPFAQRCASVRYTSSFVRSNFHSATIINSGIAIPIAAKMM